MADLESLLKDVEIIRSKRKTLALQIAADGHLIVRSPLRYPDKEIGAFIEKNKTWIEKHITKVQQVNREMARLEPFTKQELEDMAGKAIKIIPERVQYYAAQLGVSYGRITIRYQRTRWGSCTGKGNLSFNCLLMATPPEVLDSVVVHELCHRLHMNHSKAFYAAVYDIFPEYDRWNRWLKGNGSVLMRRMVAGLVERNHS